MSISNWLQWQLHASRCPGSLQFTENIT
jgi:hypothetical protein